MFIIICPIEFFVKQSSISCVVIVNIFVSHKIISKDFRKIMEMYGGPKLPLNFLINCVNLIIFSNSFLKNLIFLCI